MRDRILKIFQYLPLVLFAVVVLTMSWGNKELVGELAGQTNLMGITAFTDGLESKLTDNLKQKYDFLDLNGAMARVLGYRSLNNTTRLENDVLSGSPNMGNWEETVRRIKQLSDFLEQEGIGFLCAHIPDKALFYDAAPPKGYASSGGGYRVFTAALEQAGVELIDMDKWFQENGWRMKDVYFTTDHHWKPEAALAATREIMKHLAQRGAEYDAGSLAESNWTFQVYENWFLGSQGRRTGTKYVGVDDLTYIYPNYPMDLFVGRISASGQLYLDLEDTVYREYFLEYQDYYNLDPYSVYLGSDYPFVYIRNSLAVNDMRIVVVGNSFRRPTECFLATQFSEIYHIDMRKYTDGTFAEFVKQVEPDFVILNNNGFADDTHNYGIDSWDAAFSGTEAGMLQQFPRITLPETTSETDCYVMASNLEAGAYGISVGEVSLERNQTIKEGSHGRFVQFVLTDIKTNQVCAQRFFYANDGQPQNWLFTVPENPDANYSIRIYNGSNKYTAGNTTDVQNLTLFRYE